MNKKYSYISNIRYEDEQKGNCHRIECITRLSSPYPSLWTDLSREITLPPSDPSSKGWRERKTWKTSGIERRKRRHSYYGNWWMDRLWSIFVESRVESRRFFITCRREGIVFRVESLNAVGKRHRGKSSFRGELYCRVILDIIIARAPLSRDFSTFLQVFVWLFPL